MKYNIEKLKQIQQLIKQKKLNIAEKEIIKYYEEYPEDEEIKYCDALLLSTKAKENSASSKELLEKAFDLFSEVYDGHGVMRYRALFEMGRIKHRINDLDCAIACFTKLIKESPYEENFAAIELSKIYRSKGQIKKARKVLQEADNPTNSNNKYVLLALAKLELQAKNRVEAKNIIRRLPAEQNNFYRKVLCLKGKIAKEEKSYEEALEYLEEGLGTEKDSIYYSCLIEKVKVYVKQNRPEEALELALGIKNNGKFSHDDIKIILGNIYEQLGRTEDAKKSYKEALVGKSRMFANEAKLNLGWLAMKEHDFEDAKRWLTEAAKENFFLSVNAYLNLAFIAIREKDYKKCYEIIRTIRKLDINEEIEKNVSKLELYVDVKTGKKVSKQERLYFEKQIIEYSEEKAIRHIQGLNNDEDKSVKFRDSDNIEQLFHQVKVQITNISPYINCLADEYVLSTPNVGTVNEISTDWLKVVCLPNSKDIVTMYPTKKGEVEEPSEFLEEKPKHKVRKRLSQIEKFNAKYNRS